MAEKAAYAGVNPTGGVSFAGGTRRESRKPMYHLVPIEVMRAIAETRPRGDLKYEPGNWKKGDKVFFVDCINHTIEHLWDAANPESFEDIFVSGWATPRPTSHSCSGPCVAESSSGGTSSGRRCWRGAMDETLKTIAIMAAIIAAGGFESDIPVAARDAADLYEAVEAELSKRRTTPQG